MTPRIEPTITRSCPELTMTRTCPVGPAVHVRTLGPVAEVAPAKRAEASEYVKYPRAAKAVFTLAAATIVFAIVQSAAILIVTAWLLLVAYMLHAGCRLGRSYNSRYDDIATFQDIGQEVYHSSDHFHENQIIDSDYAFPGGYNSQSIARYGDPTNYN